ncbi:F-box domain-containing protein [Favolaschia claudopus]|uniref:F-box domain-containing protein n=1 Tax=Favolaschia claudopus TaxID=2862362 RepID=A0AAV9ZMI2_9AGAR
MCADTSVETEATLSLPFVEADPAEEISPRSARNLETVNYATVEAWKSLRIARLKVNYVPSSLSLFPSTQLDIILEVLAYLHPLELSQLSRTNKAFRELLASPIADPIWGHSLLVDDHPENTTLQLPQCPAGIPGQRWTRLLFGRLKCEQCGEPGTSDYILCRRICPPCADQNLLDVIPGYDATHVLNWIVHRTQRAPASDDLPWDYHRGRFWRSDADAVVAEYERLSTGDDSAVAISSFIEARKKSVAELTELADRCNEWYWAVRHTSSMEYSKKLDKVSIRAAKRLVAEGFDQRDVDSSFYDINDCELFYRKPRLTSKLWNRARPFIVPSVLAARTQRLKHERELRIQARKQAILGHAITKLQAAVPGVRHGYHLPPHTIVNFPPLAQLIEEDSEDSISADDPRLIQALEASPAFVETWILEMKKLLIAVLPKVESQPQQLENLGFHRLELASSVFRIHRTGMHFEVAIGWDEARAHLHRWTGEPELPFPGAELVQLEDQGSRVAAELVLLVGLNPDIATASQMDFVDARFVCNDCSPESQGQRHAMDWRQCVVHSASKQQDISHDVPSWTLLSPLAAADVRRRDGSPDYTRLPSWSCTLCNDFLPSRLGRHRVVKYHLYKAHSIENPIEGEHLVHFLLPIRPPRRRIMLFEGGSHPARFRCNRCAQTHPSVVKLFSMRALTLHVPDKHQVEFSDSEYTEAQLLL